MIGIGPPAGIPFTMKRANIELAADGEVVAAVAGHFICVTFVHLTIKTATTTFYWKSGATAIGGTEILSVGSGYNVGFLPYCLCTETVATALNMAVSGGAVAGWVYYYETQKL